MGHVDTHGCTTEEALRTLNCKNLELCWWGCVYVRQREIWKKAHIWVQIKQ